MIIDLTRTFSSTPVASDESTFTSLNSLDVDSRKFDWEAWYRWRDYVDRFGEGISYQKCSRDKWSQKFIPIFKNALEDEHMQGVLARAAPNRTRSQIVNIIRDLNCSKLSVDLAAKKIADLDRMAHDEKERKKEEIL